MTIAKRTGALIITNFEVAEWLGKQGAKKTHPLNPGGSMKLDVCRVKFVNAIHSSSFPDGTYGGNPGGFVIESDEGNFYYSGDTALTLDMKLIGESTKLKWAALCVGDNFTMGPDDAIKACDFIQCNEVLGVHYDTFPPIKIDHKAAIEKLHGGMAGGRQIIVRLAKSQESRPARVAAEPGNSEERAITAWDVATRSGSAVPPTASSRARH